MRLAESIYKNIKESDKVVKEAIEPKYEKSNEDYNSFLRDVRHYTGSYEYLFGGKVSTEVNGTPIRVDYFYYNRPYVHSQPTKSAQHSRVSALHVAGRGHHPCLRLFAVAHPQGVHRPLRLY